MTILNDLAISNNKSNSLDTADSADRLQEARQSKLNHCFHYITATNALK
jgi:hypothetical protein